MQTITIELPDADADALSRVSPAEVQAAVMALLHTKREPKKELLDLALFDALPPSGRTSEQIEAELRADRASWGEREKQWRP